MDHFERLSALDGSFLGLEHRSAKMHIGATLVFDAAPLTLPDGRLAFDRIRAVLDARLHEVPRYRQRIAYVPLEQHAVWVDDLLFHIDDSLHHARLPAHGHRRQLQQLASRIKSRRLDRAKPLREMWIIGGLLVRGVASVRHHRSGSRLRGVAQGFGNPAPGWLA